MATARTPSFDLSVFVNCPFDDAYKPLLNATLFAIHDCGFLARLALEDIGSGETRLDKIKRIIDGSRFSIHDISRVEISPASPLPRFNMPFECGLAFGALFYKPKRGDKQRDVLLLAGDKYQDKQTLSDLAGQDASYHENKPDLVIRAVRRFLAAKAQGVLPAGISVRGHESIIGRFARFQAALPTMLAALKPPMDPAEIETFDCINEWLIMATVWQRSNI